MRRKIRIWGLSRWPLPGARIWQHYNRAWYPWPHPCGRNLARGIYVGDKEMVPTGVSQ
jgi:hypothetical protein